MRFILFAISFLFCNSAFGQGEVTSDVAAVQDPGSIYRHLPGENKWELTGSIKYRDSKVEVDPVAYQGYESLDIEGYGEFLKLAYGINDMFAVALEVGYGDLDYTLNGTPSVQFLPSDWTAKGFLDPVVSFHGRFRNVGPGTLQVGMPVSIGMGKREADSNFNRDQKSGATFIDPYIGYEYMIRLGSLVGINLSYMTFIGDREVASKYSFAPYVSPGTTALTEGQKTQLDVYYEQWFSSKFMLGVDLNFANVAETKSSFNGGAKSDDDNGMAGLGYGLYATWLAMPNLAITPVLGKLSISDNGGYTNVTGGELLIVDLFATYSF